MRYRIEVSAAVGIKRIFSIIHSVIKLILMQAYIIIIIVRDADYCNCNLIIYYDVIMIIIYIS